MVGTELIANCPRLIAFINLKIFTSKSALSKFLNELREQKKSIGFVPTMGALHEGHLSLIDIARRQSDVIVCSIFVNPTQFNDPADLEKYPRPVDADIEKLRGADVDILFLPSVEEMYEPGESWHLDLGYLENVLEGKIRPGHYQGVTQVVKKFFDIVKPDVAFFGQKDFQQVLILRSMVKMLNIPVKLVMCPIKREEDGLALSSRNIHLSSSERHNALALSASLNSAKDHFSVKSLDELKSDAIAFLSASEGVELDYFEIYDAETLQPATSKDVGSIVALVAAKVGETRLIDNILLK
ncbi:pantoate--beta-alanine ligase [Arcticibacter tournemirensis]|uniref:pantoate--beta-alanine ligase n=1 Tax=Arcticibacter tournemirensis TaxID=699437 RepID=UPI002938D432|nr:pantoate--beta-alanine ligase [Arcticibacter tournemirensis]